MPTELLTVPGNLERGTILGRPNRFVLSVSMDDGRTERAYISNTGSWNVTKEGRPVLLRQVSDPERKTAFDAVFVGDGDVWVSVDASFANTAFETAVQDQHLETFLEYGLRRSEPTLPDGGRADFELGSPAGETVLVEVKSCTLVEDGVALFPDRPTERGRRHVRELTSLQEEGTETHVVFVVQRADGDRFRPNREVDPELATVLVDAAERGVGIHAMQLAIDPPTVFLETAELPVELHRSDW